MDIDVDIDIMKLLQKVMRIHGFKIYIPEILKFYKGDIKSFWLLSEGITDDSSGRIIQGRQKVAVFSKDGKRTLGEVPIEEVTVCLKAAFNFIIVDGIKKYIRVLKNNNSDDNIASDDSIYLVSCYLACIYENIEKEQYLEFTTSICRKTGAKIIRDQMKKKKISHRTQYGKQMLEK